jgi:CRP/FNR family nitrogen fixation transcriptional regulator
MLPRDATTGTRAGAMLPPLPALAGSGLAGLGLAGTTVTLGRDQSLFLAGDDASHVFRVMAGCVRSLALMPDGRRQVAEFHLAGDLLGLDGRDAHRLSAEGVGDAILLRFPRRQLEAAAVRDPAAARDLYDLACRSLEVTQRRLMVLGRKTAAERLASFLLEMAERCGGSRRFALPMSRQDIADHLGLTIETVSRVFSQFRRKGLIALPTAQRVELRDREALEGASGDAARW